MGMAAFEHVRRLGEVHDHLTATELKPGFVYQGERIPLINPQRGIFKPASQKPVGNSTASRWVHRREGTASAWNVMGRLSGKLRSIRQASLVCRLRLYGTSSDRR